MKIGSAKEIKISVPFILDEQIAKLSGMSFDGSLSKDLANFSFYQKKDKKKIEECAKIIKNKFGVVSRIGMAKNKTPVVIISSKTLCHFLHECLDFYKSDERGVVPKWLWNSPKSVIISYLRESFDMEGSIADPSTGKREIRFHGTDKNILTELKKLMKIKFDINCDFFTYHIENYGEKYYLAITNSNEILKFNQIGFGIETHSKRLKKVISKIKNKKKKTNPRENEKKILKLLGDKKLHYRNEISRKTGINSTTVRGVLQRLIRKGNIKKINKKDKFQRKFYRIMA